MNRVAVPGDATCPMFAEGMDRLLPTEGVEGTDDTPAVGEGAAAQGVGVVSRLALSCTPWRGRGARTSGVAEGEEGFSTRADACGLSASWARLRRTPESP